MSGDEAILRMLAGANFGPDASLILPSGRELKGDEAQALTSFYADEKRTEVAPPWRFDVPEVPAHVTALKDSVGDVWVRFTAEQRRGMGIVGSTETWARWLKREQRAADHWDLSSLLDLAPLVECPDPRTTS